MASTSLAVGSEPTSMLARLGWSARAALAALRREPRRNVSWSLGRSGLCAVVAVLAVAATMRFVDPWSLAHVRALPTELVAFFQSITDFGLGGWFLVPTGLVLVVLGGLDRARLPRFVRGMIATLAVRIGFVFLAVLLPGLFVTCIKYLIGRARPFASGQEVWAYKLFSRDAAYASMPSGHTATVFCAAVAIGSIWPRARLPMWVFAVLIAASRVAIAAHYPSDVLAGAIVGTAGALLVRQWFACRGLGFQFDSLNRVRPLPGPSRRHFQRAWRVLFLDNPAQEADPHSQRRDPADQPMQAPIKRGLAADQDLKKDGT